MYLRTFSHCRWNRNLRYFSRPSVKNIYDCDINGSPLLQSFIGSEMREELTLGLPMRYYIKWEDLHVDGFSCCDIEMLGYMVKVLQKDRKNSHFLIETNDGNKIVHRLREIPGKENIQNIEEGDLVLAQGHLSSNLKNKKVEPYTTKYNYMTPIVVMDIFKMGRDRSCKTFSNATLFGRVLGNYFPLTKHIDYVGQLNLLTWMNTFGDNRTEIPLQINRIFISETTLGLFPFITQLGEGDHLMVTGSLDYFKHPLVNGVAPAVKAKQVIRVEKMYKKREVA